MSHRAPGSRAIIKAGPLIRLGGLALLALPLAAARFLFLRAGTPHAGQSVSAYACALVAFACASVGSAMLSVGAHLFDHMDVSPRWRRLR